MPARTQSHYARGQARRTKVLEATVEVIAERGLEGVTHRSVAAQAGYPPSTPGYFFGSIDELIGATVTHIAEEVLASVNALTAAASSGEVDGDQLAAQLLELLADARPTLVRVQFQAYLASERRPELREAVQRIMQGFEAATTVALAAVGVEHSEAAARHFVAVIDGFALHRIAWPREADDVALGEVLRRLLASYLESPATPTR